MRGQKANEILAKNSGPIADQLGAALLKGPSAMHMKSADVEETRQENAYKQARSGADSWSGAFTRRMNSFVSSVASVARSVLPERFSHGITQYAQERQEAPPALKRDRPCREGSPEAALMGSLQRPPSRALDRQQQEAKL